MMDVSVLLRGLSQTSRAFENAVEQTIAEAADVAYQSLLGTTSFRNRSYSLRAAFAVAGSGPERTVFVDPSASGPRKTPPNTYARFLDSGTSRIAARGFGAEARSRGEQAAVFIAEQTIGAVL